MTKRSTGLALAALGAALVTSISAASPAPYLRSVGVQRSHVVALFTLGDLLPGQIVVAVKPATQRTGAFLPGNVRLKEQMRPTATRDGYRWRTRHTLRAGRYYVQVSGIVLGLDCTPHKPCPIGWSNVRRVIVRRP